MKEGVERRYENGWTGTCWRVDISNYWAESKMGGDKKYSLVNTVWLHSKFGF